MLDRKFDKINKRGKQKELEQVAGLVKMLKHPVSILIVKCSRPAVKTLYYDLEKLNFQLFSFNINIHIPYK